MTRKASKAFEDAAREAARVLRLAREIRETAETLVEDRGRANALAWAEHCMVRDPARGFWRAVRDTIRDGGFRAQAEDLER